MSDSKKKPESSCVKQPHKSSRRSPDMRRRSNSVRERERGKIDGCFLWMWWNGSIWRGRQLCLPLCLSPGLLPLSEECVRGGVALCLPRPSHGFPSKIFVIWQKHTDRHIYNHILALTAQTKTLPSSPLDASDGPPKPLCDSNTRSHVITTFLRFGLYQHTGHYKCVRSTRVALTDL